MEQAVQLLGHYRLLAGGWSIAEWAPHPPVWAFAASPVEARRCRGSRGVDSSQLARKLEEFSSKSYYLVSSKSYYS